MNKRDLVESIAGDAQITRVQAAKALEAFVRTVQSSPGQRRPGDAGGLWDLRRLPPQGAAGAGAAQRHHHGDQSHARGSIRSGPGVESGTGEFARGGSLNGYHPGDPRPSRRHRNPGRRHAGAPGARAGHRVVFVTMTPGDCGSHQHPARRDRRHPPPGSGQCRPPGSAPSIAAPSFATWPIFNDDASRRRVTEILRQLRPELVLTVVSRRLHVRSRGHQRSGPRCLFRGARAELPDARTSPAAPICPPFHTCISWIGRWPWIANNRPIMSPIFSWT